MGMTISDRMLASKGHPSGFDYLRFVLAVSVMVIHTIPACYGVDALWAVYMTPVRPLFFVIVPAFFAVSGFLVAASFQRVKNIPVFLTLRAVRILPALLCVVLISTFVLGPILTALPLGVYVTDRMTWTYLLGAFGFARYSLPGVFSYNPIETVNASLWTIPWEMKCYLLLPVLGIIALLDRPRGMAVASVAVNMGAFSWSHQLGHLDTWDQPGGGFLISCFFWGGVLYLNRNKILYSRWICAGAMLAAYSSVWRSPGAAHLAAFPVAYASIYLGLQNPGKIRLIRDRDLSYGVYLYGWPVQQTIASLLPYGRIWYVNFGTSLIVTACIAWLSWTLLESKALARKGQAARFVDAAFRRVQQSWWKFSAKTSLAKDALRFILRTHH